LAVWYWKMTVYLHLVLISKLSPLGFRVIAQSARFERLQKPHRYESPTYRCCFNMMECNDWMKTYLRINLSVRRTLGLLIPIRFSSPSHFAKDVDAHMSTPIRRNLRTVKAQVGCRFLSDEFGTLFQYQGRGSYKFQCESESP
jgi:hypothetical protein